MRKIILLISVLMLTVITAFTQTWNIGKPNAEDVTATLSEGVLTISGTGEMQDWSPVLVSPWRDLSYKNEVNEAIIEEGVTNVGENAFAECSNLTSVTLPESMKKISEGAFAMCASLSSINILCESIGNFAFVECRNLSSVEFSENIKNIGEGAFLNCQNLTLITFKNPVPPTIGDLNFEYLRQIQCVVPEGSEEIYLSRGFPVKVGDDLMWYIGNNSGVFAKLDQEGTLIISGTGEIRNFELPLSALNSVPWNPENIKNVVIESGVTSIGRYTFSNCRNLTSITIPENVTKIEPDAFQGCSNLETVNFNATHCVSDYLAFQGCNALTTVNIGESVESLPNGIFQNNNLQTIVCLNSTPAVIQSNTFGQFGAYGSNGKLKVPAASVTAYRNAPVWKDFNVEIEGLYHMKVTVNNPEGGTVSYTNTLYELGDEVTLTAIAAEKYGFTGWTTAYGLPVSTENPYTFSIAGDEELVANFQWNHRVNARANDITYGTVHGFEHQYELGEEATLIATPIKEDYVFVNWMTPDGEYLSSENPYTFIVEGIHTIVANFQLDPNIKQWYVGSPNARDVVATLKGTTLTISGTGNMQHFDMYKSPFYENEKTITTVVVEEGVTSIGSFAFDQSFALESLSLPQSLKEIGQWAFRLCNLTSLTIPENVTEIRSSTFESCRNLTSVVLPESVTKIGDYAFGSCESLASVVIPESVTAIGRYAFVACESLASIVIPQNVTTIGEKAFGSCDNLQEINVDENSQYFTSREGVLYNKAQTLLMQCPAGKEGEVTIPESVLTIAEYAFVECKNLTSVSIPEGVTTIKREAFSHCDGLASIVIPESITTIEIYAFSYCDGLTSVFIPQNVTKIGGNPFLGCKNLQEINVDENNPDYSSKNGIFYNKAQTKLLQYPINKEGERILINAAEIGDNALSYCLNLTSVTFSENVINMERNPFFGCTNLTSIVCLNPVPIALGSIVFANGVKKDECILYVPSGSLEAYREAAVWREFNIVELPEVPGVSVDPSDNSAVVEWERIEDAAEYKIIIYGDEARTDIHYVLEFDADGTLTDISSLLKSESANFSHTIENLSNETPYYYTIHALGADKAVLALTFGKFETEDGLTTGSVETEGAPSLQQPRVTGYYSVLGVKLQREPQSGIYIILYDSGKAEKVIKNTK
jgi:hypothetical protein